MKKCNWCGITLTRKEATKGKFYRNTPEYLTKYYCCWECDQDDSEEHI